MRDVDEVASDLYELHKRFIAKSGITPGSIEDERFLALAMAGEGGEVANFIKKQWRGDVVDRGKLKDELSDVFAYWATLVKVAGFDVIGVTEHAVTKAKARLDELERTGR